MVITSPALDAEFAPVETVPSPDPIAAGPLSDVAFDEPTLAFPIGTDELDADEPPLAA